MTRKKAEGADKDPLESFSVDHKGNLPVWVQIRNRILHLIMSGAYQEGDRLPTVRSLALKLDISYNTVNRAYIDLERDGYITTRRGRGSAVAKLPSDADESEERMAQVRLLADELVGAALDVGLDESDVVGLVRESFAKR